MNRENMFSREEIVEKQNMKFKEFSAFWLEKYARVNLTAKTVGDYKCRMRIINDALGNKSLKQINSKMILDFCNSLTDVNKHCTEGKARAFCDFDELLARSGMSFSEIVKKAAVSPSTITSIRQKRNVEYGTAMAIAKAIGMPYEEMFETMESKVISQKTVKNYLHLMTSVLKMAVVWGIIDFNPARSVELLPVVSVGKEDSISDEELIVFSNHLEAEPIKWRIGIYVTIHTKITRGELLGLEWKDIDFANKTLSIDRASQVIAGLGIIELSGADFQSQRKVKLNETVISLLREYQLWQQNEISHQGGKWCTVFKALLPDGTKLEKSNDRLFTKIDGTPMNPDSYTDWLAKFCDKKGIRRLNLNMLRLLEMTTPNKADEMNRKLA